MAPDEGDQWTMGIVLFIRMLVVIPMDRDPFGRRVLHAAQGNDHEETLKPLGQLGAVVRQDPVVTQIDSLAEDVDPEDHHDQAGPAEQPWNDGCQGQDMDQRDGDGIGPYDLATDDRVRERQAG